MNLGDEINAKASDGRAYRARIIGYLGTNGVHRIIGEWIEGPFDGTPFHGIAPTGKKPAENNHYET